MANTIEMSQKSISLTVILPISKLTETWCQLEDGIHGIPWTVDIGKNEEENSLGVSLQCEEKNKSPNWSVPAWATIKLMPFAQNKSPHVRHVTPFVFRPSELSIGESSVIGWTELMSDQNKYVKNDAIQLKIKITVENPNYVDRSALKIEPIGESCNCGLLASFRLTVTNIENLLAVCSAPFTVRGLPWNLTVYKHQTSKLGVMLDLIDPSEEASCKMKMSVKLLSSKGDVHPIGKIAENQIEQSGNLNIDDIISWEDLWKSENGFVTNNSITLEVKLKADKPSNGDVPDASPSNAVAAKRRRLICSICSKGIDGQGISTTTPCGHLFCTVCITKAIKNHRVCPVCKKAVKNLQRINLPMSN